MEKSTTNETELKYHVPELPNPAVLARQLTALGWHVYNTKTNEHSDTYIADVRGVLKTQHAALRWRFDGTKYIVAIKQERGSDGAHFARFELEEPAETLPAHAAHGLVLNIDESNIPSKIAQWLATHSVRQPFATQAWLVTTRTVLQAGATGVLAEFALDHVQARKPGGSRMHEFYEIECEYEAQPGHPLIHKTANFLAELPGATPSWASKLDFARKQLS